MMAQSKALDVHTLTNILYSLFVVGDIFNQTFAIRLLSNTLAVLILGGRLELEFAVRAIGACSPSVYL